MVGMAAALPYRDAVVGTHSFDALDDFTAPPRPAPPRAAADPARRPAAGRPLTSPGGFRLRLPGSARAATVRAHRSGHREVGRVSITASRSSHVTSR
ncbi:hypothetical protein ACWELO_18065 [Streptomyces sp. NPDC004596]|uniref:hypothetical protein n=1 Tax=Streptomyces sp. DSM 118148 TaxID=3448667 RepID=UPI00403FCAE3